MIPSLMSPVTAVVARPEPIAPIAVAPRLPKPRLVANAPPAIALPPKLPSKGNKKGKNASGCPVIGFVVNSPVGDKDANP